MSDLRLGRCVIWETMEMEFDHHYKKVNCEVRSQEKVKKIESGAHDVSTLYKKVNCQVRCPEKVKEIWDRRANDVWSQIGEMFDLRNDGNGVRSLQESELWSPISGKSEKNYRVRCQTRKKSESTHHAHLTRPQLEHQTLLDGYCSTVQGLLDWFEVDLGFTELLFIQIDLCVLCVFGLYSRVSFSSCPFSDKIKFYLSCHV